MKKGTKLGPRDYWQTWINYYLRQGEMEMVEHIKFRRNMSLFNSKFIEPYLKEYGEHAGFVYVLKSLKYQDVYKIGMTRNLRSRMNSFRAEHKNSGVHIVMLRQTDDCEMVEKLLIDLFSPKKTDKGREWFTLNEEDLQTLKGYFLKRKRVK